MSPQKQAAQTANAQKSHGATTEAGRARSSQNSIRHSLCSKKYFIVPEDRPEFDIYYNDLIAALAPEGAVESMLAEAIILDSWRMTRARLVENQIFCRGYMSVKSADQFIAGAETWLANSKELATLTLYEQRINRVLTRNKTEFDSRQAARGGAGLPACAFPTTQSQEPEATQVAAEPAVSHPETAAPEQPAGFVHSSEAPPPPLDSQPAAPAAKQPAGFVRSSVDLPTTQSQEPEASQAPAEPADSNPETAAPEQLAGFVHSSEAPAPTPDPQPLTPAAKRPAAARRAA